MKLQSLKKRNKKKTKIVIFTLSSVLLIVGFFYSSFTLFKEQNNCNIHDFENSKNTYFAYYIDNELTYDIPKKNSGYTLSSQSNCTNGVTISWDVKNWHALVNYTNYHKETSPRVKCSLYFTKTAAKYLNDLAKTDTTNLLYDGTSDNNLRYVGKSPNNYVDIGDKDSSGNVIPWRIIGVMNNVDNGSDSKETRLKVVRNESIGSYSWDTTLEEVNSGYGVNEWKQSKIMKLLNPGYEAESIGGSLYWNKKNGTCYNGQNNASGICDFTSTGLSENAKKNIDEIQWATGSNGSTVYNAIKANEFYTLEKSSNNGKICTSGVYCNDNIKRTTKWQGNIGLIYPSDYGYATAGGQTTNRETCLNTLLYGWNETEVLDCKNNDWLYSDGMQWTMMPLAYAEYAYHSFCVNNAASVSYSNAYNAASIRPTAYLLPSAKIIDGDGTIDNMYKIE